MTSKDKQFLRKDAKPFIPQSFDDGKVIAVDPAFDPEVEAMKGVYIAIKHLDEGAEQRVIDWVQERLASDRKKVDDDLPVGV